MKNLLLICFLAAAVFAGWKYLGRSTGNAAITDLEQRLAAAESTYQSAGRAAGMSGVDSTADAEAALSEVEHVEQALKDLSRTATSDADKQRIRQLLDRAAEVKRRMR